MAIQDILKQLSEPLPADDIKTLRKGGATLSYIPHYRVKERLNEICPDWSGEVKQVLNIGGKIAVVYRLTIGDVSREAIGYEDDADGLYGDPFSNAEAMAFKRAAAWFGLGLYLYDKDAPRKPASKPKSASNGKAKSNAKWAHDAETVRRLMAAAEAEFGLSPADVHLALLVDDIGDFDGAKNEAWKMLKRAASN